MLAQLVGRVKAALEMNINKVHYWTDLSIIVLHWIKATNKKLSVFVAHRVGEIRNRRRKKISAMLDPTRTLLISYREVVVRRNCKQPTCDEMTLSGKPVSKESSLRYLDSWFDKEGLIRVESRLRHGELHGARHPLAFPHGSRS